MITILAEPLCYLKIVVRYRLAGTAFFLDRLKFLYADMFSLPDQGCKQKVS